MQSTYQTATIPAPISEVWKQFNDFHAFPFSRSVITSIEKVGDKPGTEVGAKRILNDAFHETLVEYNPIKYRLSYTIDDGPSPVSREEVANYVGVIQLSVSEEGDSTLVEWSSSWNANTEDAVEFCHGIYVALLEELKTAF